MYVIYPDQLQTYSNLPLYLFTPTNDCSITNFSAQYSLQRSFCVTCYISLVHMCYALEVRVTRLN